MRGGDDRDRTGDLLVANEALSQLSYIPTCRWTSENWRRERDSNPRSTFMLTRFPTVLLQPLGHLSGEPRRTRAPSRAIVVNGGERGIRTLDTLARIAVFETARFSHSRISPPREYANRAQVSRRFMARRRARKNCSSNALASAASTPGTTSAR